MQLTPTVIWATSRGPLEGAACPPGPGDIAADIGVTRLENETKNLAQNLVRNHIPLGGRPYFISFRRSGRDFLYDLPGSLELEPCEVVTLFLPFTRPPVPQCLYWRMLCQQI